MSNKPTIAEWQRASADSPAATREREAVEAQRPVEAPTPTEEDIETDDSQEQPIESTDLREQASRFLEDPSIRDAPRERKVAFLESKGVKHVEIASLLGAETQGNSLVELEDIGERAWPTVSAQSL
jgi:hypothetical protein